ncbi:MAG: hypothetical protein ABI670_01125 [Chloroflexota bacterium]
MINELSNNVNEPIQSINGTGQAVNSPSGSASPVPFVSTLSLASKRRARLIEGMSAMSDEEFAKIEPELAPTISMAFRGASPDAKLPTVNVYERQLRDISDDMLAALVAANNPPQVYVRGGRLVRVRMDEMGRPVIDAMTDASFRHRLSQVATYVRVVPDRGGAPISIDTAPPRGVVSDIMARPAWPLPALEGVTEVPTLRSDGSIHNEPGYDRGTRLLYVPAPDLTIPSISENPSGEEVQAALNLMIEAVGDFPYVDDASRANTLALMLTAIARPAIRGNVPLALVDAPTQGTGKTLLVKVIALINTGRPAAVMTAPNTEDEWRKRITGLLGEGATYILIDNVEGVLNSVSLAAVLTADSWKDRLLGTNAHIEVPQRATWMATGNNIAVGGDLPRRCYWIRLNAHVATPWTRGADTFRHPELLDWVAKNRGALVGAMLTLVRAWHVAGQPAAVTPSIGGYENWARVIGGVLEFAGVKGFLSNLDVLYKSQNEEPAEWGAFLKAWAQEYGERTVTVAQVCADLGQKIGLRVALPADLAEALEQQRPESTAGFGRRLGRALAKHADVVYHMHRLERGVADGHANAAQWRVRPVMPVSETAPRNGPGRVGSSAAFHGDELKDPADTLSTEEEENLTRAIEVDKP